MRFSRVPLKAAISVVAASLLAAAQSTPDDQVKQLGGLVQQLQSEVRQLQEAVSELRQESNRYRSETEELRRELGAGRRTEVRPASASSEEQAPSADQRLDAIEEQQQLLAARVNEQHDTKVESASKYRVRLSGIVLLNLFNNRGAVDNVDIPTTAAYPEPLQSNGSIGATVRQSLIGLEVLGPTVAGARTSAEVQMDFGGGFPNAPNGSTTGIFRLRTAALRMNWDHTSVVAGQDTLFFAPLAPTSFATLAVPALAYSGNLWSWTPQLRVEHTLDLSDISSIKFSAGVLEPLTGVVTSTNYLQQPGPGENSRVPAAASRIAWTHRAFGKSLSIGGGGYYSQQNWGYDRIVNGWAGLADINLPITTRAVLSGEFYRGSAIGGLGGGLGRSVLWNGPLLYSTSIIHPLNAAGGWTQLKILATPKIQFNGAVGEDNSFASDLRALPNAQSYGDPGLARNRSAFANVVYRPRSDLLLALELRRLRTFSISGDANAATHLNLAMGYLF
jgi:regulator of replication initiation timing